MSTPFEALIDYETGATSDADAERFEEELFAAAAAGEASEADFVDHMARLAQHLEPRGGFDIGSSRARIDQLIASGLRVQLIEPVPGDERVEPIDDDAEIVATHVPIDVRGYDSVDVEIARSDGTKLKTFRDIGWDPLDGTVYAVCEGTLARISAKQRDIRSRVIGYRGGKAHVIATFRTITAP